MAGSVWYWLADGTEESELYPTLDAAKLGLEKALDRHSARGHKVEFEVCGEGRHPLWLVENDGEVIAKYRLIE